MILPFFWFPGLFKKRPVVTSIVITSTNGNLYATVNTSVACNVSSSAGLSLAVTDSQLGASSPTLTYVSGSGSTALKFQITVNLVLQGDTVTASYNGGNIVATTGGAGLQTFSSMPATNNSLAVLVELHGSANYNVTAGWGSQAYLGAWGAGQAGFNSQTAISGASGAGGDFGGGLFPVANGNVVAATCGTAGATNGAAGGDSSITVAAVLKVKGKGGASASTTTGSVTHTGGAGANGVSNTGHGASGGAGAGDTGNGGAGKTDNGTNQAGGTGGTSAWSIPGGNGGNSALSGNTRNGSISGGGGAGGCGPNAGGTTTGAPGADGRYLIIP